MEQGKRKTGRGKWPGPFASEQTFELAQERLLVAIASAEAEGFDGTRKAFTELLSSLRSAYGRSSIS